MRAGWWFALLLIAPAGKASDSCEISGDARLWAYDECLWRFETDDTLHPGVMECYDRDQIEIRNLGSCPAKRVFKQRICDLAKAWALSDPAPATCMKLDQPLGPSVRDGGI